MKNHRNENDKPYESKSKKKKIYTRFAIIIQKYRCDVMWFFSSSVVARNTSCIKLQNLHLSADNSQSWPFLFHLFLTHTPALLYFWFVFYFFFFGLHLLFGTFLAFFMFCCRHFIRPFGLKCLGHQFNTQLVEIRCFGKLAR